MRLSFVGELGWELHIPRAACLPVYHAVMAAGAKHGIINSGYRAIDSLSIEKGGVKGQRSNAAFLSQTFLDKLLYFLISTVARLQALARRPPA